MGLRKRYKSGGYVQKINEAAGQGIEAQADGTIEQQFYVGVMVAAQEAQHDRLVPPDRQAWLDNLNRATGYGWLITSALIFDVVKDGAPSTPYRLPPVPTEQQLEELGRPRTSTTIWYESLNGLETAIREVESDWDGILGNKDAQVMTTLEEARKGFVTLVGQGHDVAVHSDLASACQSLLLAIEQGDLAELQEKMRNALASLMTARAFNPR
jgi:hypothetical protein